MEDIKVLVVDDHSLFRKGIVSVLVGVEGLNVLGEAFDGLDAVNKAKEVMPNIILMDLNMPRCNGLEATKILQAEMPQVNILVLTISESETDLLTAVKFGARGYVLKNIEPQELIQTIFHVAQGGVLISPSMATKLIGEFNRLSVGPSKEVQSPNIDTLSSREDEILQLVATGATNKQIASTLFISENTVKTHLRNIMEKLHFVNRSQAAVYAANNATLAHAGV